MLCVLLSHVAEHAGHTSWGMSLLHDGILPLPNHWSDADPNSLLLQPTHILCYCFDNELCAPSLCIQRADQELPEVAVGKGYVVSVLLVAGSMLLSKGDSHNRLSGRVLSKSKMCLLEQKVF